MNEKFKTIKIVSLSMCIWYAITLGYNKLLSPIVSEYVGDLFGVFLKSILIPYGIGMPIAHQALKTVKPVKLKNKNSFTTSDFVKIFIIQSGIIVFIVFIITCYLFS